MKPLFSLLLLVLLAACRTSTPPTADVRSRSGALAIATGAQDLDAVLALWTPTAVVHLEGTPALRGRTEIASMYRELFPELVSYWSETHELRISGDLACELGTQHLTIRETELRTLGIRESTRKYVAIWTRGHDGQWRLDALSLTRNP